MPSSILSADGILVQVSLVVLKAKCFEGTFAKNSFVHRSAGEPDIGGIRQASHKEIPKVATGGTVGLVNEDVDIRAPIDICWHVMELVDHRHDDAPVVVSSEDC